MSARKTVTCNVNVTAPRNNFKTITDFCQSHMSFRMIWLSCSFTYFIWHRVYALLCLSFACVSCSDFGPGYAWSPACLTVSVGDTVVWRWETPPFQDFGYRVFSVSKPGSTKYDGGAFNSGDTKTPKGRVVSQQSSGEAVGSHLIYHHKRLFSFGYWVYHIFKGKIHL